MERRSSVRYSIREVSEATGVAPHTLRFWEKALDPLLRPYRTPGGQRRYDEAHVTVIRDVQRRVNEERQSLAAVRRELTSARRSDAGARDLGTRVLADPLVQQALDDVAAAVKARVLRLLEERTASELAATDVSASTASPHGATS